MVFPLTRSVPTFMNTFFLLSVKGPIQFKKMVTGAANHSKHSWQYLGCLSLASHIAGGLGPERTEILSLLNRSLL